MATVNLYFSRMRSIRYVFPDGSEAAFIDGKFATADEDKIYHLNSEVAKGHPHIFIDPAQVSCDEKDLDPYEQLKKKVLADLLSAGEVQLTQDSSYAQEQVKPAGSDVLVDVPTATEQAAATAGVKINLK